MKDPVNKSPDSAQIKDALEAILESSTFEDVHRLRAFLEYIVTAKMKDHRARIRAKIIAADVYGRLSDTGSDQEAIVRVDAGRLRRRLDLYYAKEGIGDAIVISIPKGGYAPAFDFRTQPEIKPVDYVDTEQEKGRSGLRQFLLVAAIGGVGFFLGWLTDEMFEDTTQPYPKAQATGSFDQNADIRLTINQVSSASLLARTFVEEARHLTFPSIDAARPKAAEILCRRAIELAPDLALGHSCDAFIQAFFAFLLPPGEEKQARLTSAKMEASKALSIDPADPFSQMASAWTLFAEGRRNAALDQATSAVNLGPNEPFLRNFYGMMMTFDGRASELLEAGFPGASEVDPEKLYHPFIIAASRLLIDNYPGVIEAVEEAVALEGRTSSLITSIQIAALENMGEVAEAEKLARNMYDTWQISDVRPRLMRFFSKTADVDAIANPVEAVFGRLNLEGGVDN